MIETTETIPSSAVGLADVMLTGNMFAGPDNSYVRAAPGEMPPIMTEENQLPLVHDVFARVFDLSDAADLSDYAAVMNELGHKLAVLSCEDRQWCAEKKNFVVFLRWCRQVYQAPIPPGTPIKKETFHGKARTVIA